MIKKLIAHEETISGTCYYCIETGEYFILECGSHVYRTLYHCTSDWLEPECPAKDGEQFEIDGVVYTLENGGCIVDKDCHEKSDLSFRYKMLDRLRMDCLYYLGYGNRYAKHLWAGNEKEQIQEMRKLWNSFPDDGKPEWLTMEQIDEFETKMCTATGDFAGV